MTWYISHNCCSFINDVNVIWRNFTRRHDFFSSSTNFLQLSSTNLKLRNKTISEKTCNLVFKRIHHYSPSPSFSDVGIMRRENICTKEWKNVSLFDLTSEEVYTWHFPLITTRPGGDIYQTSCNLSTEYSRHHPFVYISRWESSTWIQLLFFSLPLLHSIAIKETPFWSRRCEALSVMNFLPSSVLSSSQRCA